LFHAPPDFWIDLAALFFLTLWQFNQPWDKRQIGRADLPVSQLGGAAAPPYHPMRQGCFDLPWILRAHQPGQSSRRSKSFTTIKRLLSRLLFSCRIFKFIRKTARWSERNWLIDSFKHPN